MNSGSSEFIYDIDLAPGEALSLPSSAVPIVGPGSWRITIEPYNGSHPEGTTRDHSAFLASYAPEGEGLYARKDVATHPFRFRLSALLFALAVVAVVLTLMKSIVAGPAFIFAATAIICLGASNAVLWLVEDVQSSLRSIDQSR